MVTKMKTILLKDKDATFWGEKTQIVILYSREAFSVF